jgi:hypothetical protein
MDNDNYNNTVKNQFIEREYINRAINFKLLFKTKIKFNKEFKISDYNEHLNIYFYEIE